MFLKFLIIFLQLHRPINTYPLLRPQMQHLFFLSFVIYSLCDLNSAKVSIILPLTMLLNSKSKKIKYIISVVNLIASSSSTDPPIVPETQRSRMHPYIVQQLLSFARSSAQVSQKIRQKIQTKTKPNSPMDEREVRLKVMALNTFQRFQFNMKQQRMQSKNIF